MYAICVGNHCSNAKGIVMSVPTVEVNVGLMRQKIKERYTRSSAFAAAAGVSRQYVGRVLAGLTVPTVERMAQFADLLGVTLDDLIVAPKVIALTGSGVPAVPVPMMA